MFRDAILNTPFTTPQANEYFTNIYGDAFNNDVSFISSLRALVAPRLPKDDHIRVRFNTTAHEASILSKYPERVVFNTITNADSMSCGDISVCSLRASKTDNDAIMDALENKFTSTFSGWSRINRITVHYRKQFKVLCFVHPQDKKVVLVVDMLDLKKLHFLEVSIIGFLPWYFDPEEGITALEMEFVKSHGLRTSNEYMRLLGELVKPYDFRTSAIKQMLSGFETRFEQQECERVKNDIQDMIAYINDYNRQIGEYLSRKNDLEIRLMGLEAKIASGSEESEIMEYFLCNRNLELESVEGTKMTFVVKSYLEYFNEDMAQNAIDNPNSYLYKPNGRGCNNIIDSEDMKKLLTEIFINQTMKIRVCAAYEFSPRGQVNARGHYGYSSIFNDYMPNPHIDGWSCLGTYSRPINELLSQHNYIGAIEQCAASCRSLNFGDSTVMATFMKRFYGLEGDYFKRKFIELPNGEYATPKEAVAWLKEQEEKANEQND